MNRTEAELEAYKLAAENAATRMQHVEASLEVWQRNYQHLADQLYASCICDTGPDTIGAADCPVHGADEYRPLALRRRARQAERERDVLRAAIERAQEWAESGAVTAKTPFGDGYREGLRDMRDILKAATENAGPSSSGGAS
jgi:hypothetical protein